MILVDKIQKIPVKTRMYGFIAFVCVLGGLFLYFIRIPMNSEIRTLEQSVADAQSRIRGNDAKIKKLDELRVEVKTLNEKLKVLSEQLPLETEVSSLLGQIQVLVNKSGLILKLWKPEKRRTHASELYEEIPITMDLSGGYHSVGVFFDQISKLTRIVNMLNIRMGGAKSGPSGATDITINCTAMTFAAVEKKVEKTPSKIEKTPSK